MRDVREIFDTSKMYVTKKTLEDTIRRMEHNFDFGKVIESEEQNEIEVKIKAYSTKYVARLEFKTEMMIADEIILSKEEISKTEDLIRTELQRHIIEYLYGDILKELSEAYSEVKYLEAVSHGGPYGRGPFPSERISNMIKAINVV